jgi:hypothetical protein
MILLPSIMLSFFLSPLLVVWVLLLVAPLLVDLLLIFQPARINSKKEHNHDLDYGIADL